MMGTDREILGKDEPLRVPTKGRPKVNRDLARLLLQAGYSPSQIARKLRCSTKTIRRIKKELIEKGELKKDAIPKGEDIVQADFDSECQRAMGISFYEWVKSQNKRYKTIFNFCRRVWEKVWKRPSLVLAKDQNNPLGAQLCQKFLETFGDDLKRIRDRKKRIRYLFRFLNRQDLCDKFLRMTASRDPLNIRRIPELELKDFPIMLEKCLNEVEKKLGWEAKTLLQFKIVTQMRTGDKERDILGLRKGGGHPSYLIMTSPDEFRCHVLSKNRLEWDITWIPRTIREALFKLYQQREEGDPIFQVDIRSLRKAFREATHKYVGRTLKLHDLRKVSITWLYVMGVPLEIATLLNEGWKDLNTPRDHYLHMRRLLKREDKEAYRERIPDWFKEGLEEYIG